MKTMALSRLVLVRPHAFPSREADRRAMGAIDVLQEAQIVDALDEAARDCRLVIGCSARPRTFPHPVLDARQCGEKVAKEASGRAPAAIVFGPERTGLANDDLDRCTYQVQIPANEDFSSLNLAAAVQLVCYETFLATREAVEHPPAEGIDLPARQKQMEYFYDHLERALVSRGYLGGQMHDVTMMKFRRLFGRSRPNAGELKLLHSLMRFIHRDGE